MADLSLAQRNARRGPARLIHVLALSLVALLLAGCLEESADTTFAFCVDPTEPWPCPKSGSAANGTATVTSSAVLSFAYIDTANEIAVITNRGTSAVDMTGWTLEAQQSGHIFTFPGSFSLFAGRFVRIRTGSGTDDDDDLYWAGSDHWPSSTDTATLKDSGANVVLICNFASSSAFNC